MKWTILLGSLLSCVAVLPGTLAQDAKCTDRNFSELANSQGEDPCTVGIKVGQICDPGFSIPSAGLGQVYQGVRAGASTQCICSTVYFTLLTVCGVCEGADTVLWDTYSFNCSQTFIEKMSPTVPIPSGLAIPHWAFTPLFQNGSINPVAIKADTQPDVIGSSSTTTRSPTATPSSPITTSPPVPSQSQVSNNGGAGASAGGTNTGAIAGGVVGGVVGLAGLVALVLFLRRRLAQKKIGDGAESGRAQMSIPPPGWVSPNQTLRETSYYADNSFSQEAPKLYNPEDPSTFPPPVSPTILRPTSPGQPTINSMYSALPYTTPSEHGEWNNRPSTMSPEI